MSHPRRIFVDLPDTINCSRPYKLTLAGEAAHHLKNVLRLTPGSTLTVVAEQSAQEYRALVTSVADPITLKVLAPLETQQVASPIASLICAMIKGRHNDLVVEKACELGVPYIIFWQAERSVVKITTEEAKQKKLSRWERIAEAAAKQSGKNNIPTVAFAPSLNELLKTIKETSSKEDRLLCCSLALSATPINEIAPLLTPAHIIIGPEGDFTEREESALVKHGFELVSLGPYTLRVETAAIAAIAMLNALWQKK